MQKRVFCLILSCIVMIGLIPSAAVRTSAADGFEISNECLEIIKEFEGFSSKPYWDYGQWTIGYGTQVPAGNLERYQKEGISEEEATKLLLEYIETYGEEVNKFITRYSLKATQSKFDALLSISYNCGTGWLYSPSTFRSAVLEGKTGNDFIFAMGQWSTAGGEVNKRLVERRLIEVNMYLNGIYSMEVPSNYCYVLYNANGGERDVKVQCYDSNLTDTSRSVPTYEGYTFAGWYTAATGGEKVEILNADTHKSTLYAHWVKRDGENDDDSGETPETEVKPVNVTVTVAGDAVNIRTGPGTDYPRVTFVNAGKELVITAVASGSGYLWGQCSDGWICLEFTNYYSVINGGNSTPETEPNEPETEPTEPETEPTEPETEPTEPETEPTEPEEEETVPDEPTVTITVTATDVNIRSGPGTSYARVGKAEKGMVLVITQVQPCPDYLWGKFSDGWICLMYTDYDKVIRDAAAEEEKSEVLLGTLAEGYLLQVYSGAGSGYPVVKYLTDGKTLQIFETAEAEGTTWGRIQGGWIDLAFVTLSNGTVPCPDRETSGTEITVSSGMLNVRQEADEQSPVTGILFSGETVTVLETVTVDGVRWGRIRQGWISMGDE